MKTLYHNGQFVPMTSEDDTFEALLVADDGTIAFTGSLVEARERAEDASEIDLAGKTVLPGFIDGHSHFTGTTQYLLNPDLSACRSFADIQNVLRDFIQKRGIDENGVVMAIGYDQNALAERRHPTKDVLDEVSRDIPIVVMQASNHMGVANSKAASRQKRLIRKAACTDAWKARMSPTATPKSPVRCFRCTAWCSRA